MTLRPNEGAFFKAQDLNFELDWLKRWALYSPHGLALTDGDSGESWTYEKLYRLSFSYSVFLKEKFGLQTGDRLAVLSSNELEYVALFFAAQRLGALLVPVNFRLTSSEISHIILDSGARLLVYEHQFESKAHEIASGHDLSTIPLKSDPESLAKKGEETLRDLQRRAQEQGNEFNYFLFTLRDFQMASNPEAPCMILYTSGTTGAPKGALLSHRMLFWNSINTTLRLNISQKDSAVIFLPLFHTGGWNVLLTPFLHRGAHVLLTKKFDARQILELSAKHKCTLLFGVPTTMDMMSRSDAFPSIDLSNIRYAIVGGEPMPLELIYTWQRKGIPVRQGFGLTEFGPNVFSLNEEDSIRKIGSIGFPNFYIDVRVIDAEGCDVGVDTVGELLLRGPMIMSGYWHNEKASQETIRDGWLYTGDLVQFDSEGFFFVVGRKKDMFISGGENVYPAEVEKVLQAHRAVREVAVIGIPDEKWGESGQAFVVRETGYDSLNQTDLIDHCSKFLAKFKIPKYFVFLQDLPKGDSGKILKKNLRDRTTVG
jgi:fatty-acyl-CoA synthase